jgi:hypothetical protein
MISASKQAPSGQAQQLEFKSIAFPADRTVLYVAEVAPLWRVSEQHIIDLLEEGKLEGFDIAGRLDYIRIPKTAIAKLSTLFHHGRASVPTSPDKPCRCAGCLAAEKSILDVINSAKAERIKPPRAHWRIPREGYAKFLAENHSLAK